MGDAPLPAASMTSFTRFLVMDVGPARTVERHSREGIGQTLRGEILEIGPGHAPFPTSRGALVTIADRSVEGGRDATWPELVGQPRGPDADLDLDLDLNGLAGVSDRAFDAVVACHLIEHLANPVEALREFDRVLRPGGRLVLVVPDRTRTFDSVREPTPLAHVLNDFDRQVNEVDAEHIREFCHAIFGQPPIHPEEVRDWYDPSKLDDARLELHRKRSIHVHCWTPEEFATVVIAILARGLVSWDLVDLYFFDDPGAVDNEFGLILERTKTPRAPEELAVAFVRRWAGFVLDRPEHDQRRLVTLLAALLADARTVAEITPAAGALAQVIGDVLVRSRHDVASNHDRLVAAEEERSKLAEQLQASDRRLGEIVGSRSYRASRLASGLLQAVRRSIRARAI
jgi:SAM-dependent methyltransferase